MLLLSVQQQAPVLLLGESWGFWFRFALLLLSIIIAIVTLRVNERRARRRATIDVVLAENHDGVLKDTKKKYAKLRNLNTDFTKLANDLDLAIIKEKEQAQEKGLGVSGNNQLIKLNGKLHLLNLSFEVTKSNLAPNLGNINESKVAENAEVVLTILNQYEFMATGIYEKAFDERIYFRMKRAVLLRDWEALRPFVLERQRIQNRETIYCEFQYLAERWSKKKPKLSLRKRLRRSIDKLK